MKKACTLFFLCLIYLADIALARYNELNSAINEFSVVEASLDNHIVFIIVTAGVLGIIKLKKNPG